MNRVQEIPYLPAELELEEEILDQLSARPGSQRCVVGRDELLLVVHQLPVPGSAERVAIFFHRRRDGIWVDAQGKGLKRLLDLVDLFDREVRRRSDLVDEADTAAEVFELTRNAGPLARSARNLVSAIEQAMQHDDETRDLRLARDRMKEVERWAEMLYHDARLTLEFWQAEQAEAQHEATERLNQIVFRLNVLAGFFLPLVALGGLFGMNVRLPGWTEKAFYLIFLMGLGFGSVILWSVVRKVKREPRSKK